MTLTTLTTLIPSPYHLIRLWRFSISQGSRVPSTGLHAVRVCTTFTLHFSSFLHWQLQQWGALLSRALPQVYGRPVCCLCRVHPYALTRVPYQAFVELAHGEFSVADPGEAPPTTETDNLGCSSPQLGKERSLLSGAGRGRRLSSLEVNEQYI